MRLFPPKLFLLHGAPMLWGIYSGGAAALCGCWHPALGAERRPSPCKELSGSRHGGMLLGTEKLPLPLSYARDFHCGKNRQGAQGLQQPTMGWRRPKPAVFGTYPGPHHHNPPAWFRSTASSLPALGPGRGRSAVRRGVTLPWASPVSAGS